MNNMLIPRYLQKGDAVGIVAPARKVSPEEMEAGIEWILGQGWKPVYTARLFGSDNQFSGTDEERRQDFQEKLDNPAIRAIFCARGGYGSIRFIDKLDFSTFVKDPKWIVGFSDVTVMHSHILQNFGVASIHGPMLFSFGNHKTSPESLATLNNALTGMSYSIGYDAVLPHHEGEAEGILCGGNLSILYALSGSVSEMDMQGKILFIEDIDEYLYHIDRMMIQLKRSGKLSGLAGLIVGGMTDMRDNAIPFGKLACEIIHEHTAEYGYPVAMGFPAGHIVDNRCLVLGTSVKLSVSDHIKLNFNL